MNEQNSAELRLAAAEIAIGAGVGEYDSASVSGMGYLLTAIEITGPGLAGPESQTRTRIQAIFNQANADLASLVHQHQPGNGQSLKIDGPLKSYRLGVADSPAEITRMSYYDKMTPTSRMKVLGYKTDNIRTGVGGTLVGFREGTPERRLKEPFMPLTGYAVPLAATIRWSGNTAQVVLHDVLDLEKVTLDGKTYPLAGDFTAAVATAAAATPSGNVGFIGLVRPEEEKDKEGLYLLEPFRKDRIPLILVHGLFSSPRTWETVINSCYGDPVIREHYQILVFFYPTGFPIPENSAELRARLKAFRQLYDPQRTNPKMREMVMIGHSMGCNLANYQIRDGGDSLWDQFFTVPVDQLDATPEFKERARRMAYFKANTDISRVVFICRPHRGSPLANGWLGALAIDLIRIPFNTLNTISGDMIGEATGLGKTVLGESRSSIGNLSVDSPILLAILKQPMPREPPLHSIIGDRGKKPGPGSSDGVVPYWSSHLEPVESQLWIDASHTTATRNPQNAIEIRRILYEHLGMKFETPAR